MKKILIGSRALNTYIPVRMHDTDYATLEIKRNEYRDGRIEYKPIPALFNYPDEVVDNVASLDMLYTLKCSHASWNIHWGKTMKGIVLMKQHGAKIIPDLYSELYKYWESVHGSKKHINLNKPNEDFFNNGLNYIQNHDRLHEKYAFYDEPLFRKCQKDKSKALLSKSIFNGWGHDMRIKLAVEELLVISEERGLNQTKAYKKIVTSLSRGWFNTFCIDNAQEIVDVSKKVTPSSL